MISLAKVLKEIVDVSRTLVAPFWLHTLSFYTYYISVQLKFALYSSSEKVIFLIRKLANLGGIVKTLRLVELVAQPYATTSFAGFVSASASFSTQRQCLLLRNSRTTNTHNFRRRPVSLRSSSCHILVIPSSRPRYNLALWYSGPVI
jgi:hypothetical protein